MPTAIVGIDAATQAERIGLPFGLRNDQAPVELERVEIAPSDPGYLIADWLKSHGSMARLLAVDAPLGWPRALGPTLCLHRAGRPLGREANKLFRRRTDDFIHDTLGKRPLDVGADRIARTAHAAPRPIRKKPSNQTPAHTRWWKSFVHISKKVQKIKNEVSRVTQRVISLLTLASSIAHTSMALTPTKTDIASSLWKRNFVEVATTEISMAVKNAHNPINKL